MDHPAGIVPSGAAHPVAEAAIALREILLREAGAARRASLAELSAIHDEKEEAFQRLAHFDSASEVPGHALEEVRGALRTMLGAAEENGMILASVIGGLDAVQARLRADLAATTNPGTYNVAFPRKIRTFSLAASVDQTA